MEIWRNEDNENFKCKLFFSAKWEFIVPIFSVQNYTELDPFNIICSFIKRMRVVSNYPDHSFWSIKLEFMQIMRFGFEEIKNLHKMKMFWERYTFEIKYIVSFIAQKPETLYHLKNQML